MVEDFLEQLSAAIPKEVEDVLRKKTKDTKKLELRLTDRTKLSNDGYACVPFIYSSVCYFVTAGLSVPAHIISRGEWVQASYPLVEICKRSALTTD
jgi:hypothetical protein